MIKELKVGDTLLSKRFYLLFGIKKHCIYEISSINRDDIKLKYKLNYCWIDKYKIYYYFYNKEEIRQLKLNTL